MFVVTFTPSQIIFFSSFLLISPPPLSYLLLSLSPHPHHYCGYIYPLTYFLLISPPPLSYLLLFLSLLPHPLFLSLYLWQVKELIDSIELDSGSSAGRLRSASLDLLRSASLDLLKSSSMDLLKSVANSSTSPSDSVAQHLKVGGGMTNNNLLMQFQADLLGLSLYRPYVSST